MKKYSLIPAVLISAFGAAAITSAQASQTHSNVPAARHATASKAKAVATDSSDVQQEGEFEGKFGTDIADAPDDIADKPEVGDKPDVPATAKAKRR